MLILSILNVAFIVGYCLLLWYYLRHWRKLDDCSGASSRTPGVTVLIPARNEEAGIGRCLASVLDQDYTGEVQCIVIDDHSEDSTADVVRSWYGERVMLLRLRGSAHSGKKHALLAGIEAATGEIILTTDADCVVPQTWVRTVVSAFTGEVRMVTGPVMYTRPHNLFERFQLMDVGALMVITGAGIRSRLHHLANGANLAFRKSVFYEVGGYEDNLHLASGEDLFLMQKIAAAYPGGVRFLRSSDAMVRTEPEQTWHAFIQQRIRWASKNSALPERVIPWIWAFVWLVHALLLAGFVGCFWHPQWVLVMLGCLLVKMVMDGRLVYEGLHFAGMQRLTWYYPSVIAVHYGYVLLMGWYAVMKAGFVWKGRRNAPQTPLFKERGKRHSAR